MAGDADLGDRVRRLEDLEEIHDLFRRYQSALDAKDFQAYSELFVVDGEFVTGELTTRGRGAIATLVEGMLGGLLGVEEGEDFHLVMNPSIDLHGDGARAEVTWVYVVRGAGGRPNVAKLGHYEDTLVRDEDGSWRFRRRRAPTDLPGRAG